jgi:hypothetical protein
MLVIGLVVGLLTIPAILQAYTDGRPPRTAGLMAVAATLLIIMAVNRAPGGYSWDEVPDVFVRVIGRFLG